MIYNISKLHFLLELDGVWYALGITMGMWFEKRREWVWIAKPKRLGGYGRCLNFAYQNQFIKIFKQNQTHTLKPKPSVFETMQMVLSVT